MMSITRSKAMNVKQAVGILMAVSTIFSACSKEDKTPGPSGNNPPGNKLEITAVSPARGIPGAIVTIQGKHFGAGILQNKVIFAGAALEAELTFATSTEIKARIPADAVTGKIIVKSGNQADTTATDFMVDPEVTAITDFNPKQGPFGTTVTITGRKFANDVTVHINGIEARVTQHSGVHIMFTVPVNTTLTAHKIRVTSGTDILETAENFTVTAAGPYARWESKNITLFPDGTAAFTSGLSFVYKNKIYWGFTRISVAETAAGYAVYDPAQSGGWALQNRPPADMAPAVNLHATAVVHNDRVFIGTGLAPDASNKWWEFHPETNTATRLTDFPQAVSGAVSFTMNNKIYAGFGGVNKQLYQFNPAGNNNQGSWDLRATGTFRELNTGNVVVLGNEAFLGRALPDLQQSRNAFYKFTEQGQLTRVADMPEDMQSLSTPSFTMGNKGYFVVAKNVWEYTPDANGGTWRAVISRADTPTIIHVAVVTVNGSPVVYGWTASGRLHEFKFN